MGKFIRQQQQFTRRAFFLGACQTACLGVLASRLYYLQFVQGERYQTQARDNRIRLDMVLPERGRLLDRSGLPLVENRRNFRLFINPDKREIMRQTLKKLSEMLDISAESMEALETKLQKFYLQPLLIREHLQWEEVARVEVQLYTLPAASIVPGHLRHYPLGEAAYHCLGYLGAVTEEERKETRNPLLQQPDYRIGKSGLEKVLEDRLQGKAGYSHVEVDVRGNRIRELERKPSQTGDDITLTIDADLQAMVHARLGEESAGVVVMDVQSGEVLVCVSTPSPDPNRFSTGISHAYWKELSNNPKNPLLNKVTQGQYPPGSTFKMLVGMAGLEKGIITPESRFVCGGHFELGKRRFHCWKRVGHGSMDYADALAQSCDVFFYHVAKQMGIEAIAEIARRFGLDAPTGIELLHEKGGVIPDPEWKAARFSKNGGWNPGDTINASIGQGYVLTTPLQLAVMVAQLANGGRRIRPTLLKVPVQEAIESEPKLTTPDVLEQAQRGMYRVVNSRRGTAYASRLHEEIGKMAGKTGTSQVVQITTPGQDQSQVPWEFRHHALFVGYAPLESPRYAVSVVVEHGGGGSAAAAPVARDVMEAVLKKYPVSRNPS